MKNLSVRFWMYFWMLLMVMIVPLEVQALTRDEIMANAERYKNHEWTPTEDNVCHTAKIDTPDRNTHESWGGDVGWE